MVKFETARDSINGRCKGRGVVEFRCNGKEESENLLQTLSSQGVKYTMKAVRNLRKEGPTTSSVAVNSSAHHINTRDLEDHVRNQWLQDMRKHEIRKERLLREMEDRASKAK